MKKPSKPTKAERLARALRENLAKRKSQARALAQEKPQARPDRAAKSDEKGGSSA